MPGHLLAIEGPDGSGKSTQVRLLCEFLQRANVQHRVMSFPRYDALPYGELIAQFLRGEFGPVDAVPPKLVALLYALDRLDARETLIGLLGHAEVLVTDRYVFSNLAFQGAKIADLGERVRLQNWILELELTHHQMPIPSANVLLEAPLALLEERLRGTRGRPRDYLRGAADIHETSMALQYCVAEEYARLAQACANLGPTVTVPTSDERGVPRSPEEIHEAILTRLVTTCEWFRW